MKKGKRYLIANDDGIASEGLLVLKESVLRMDPTADVWVIAPSLEQSGTSQSLTLVTPLRVQRFAEKCFAVSGTPSDCVILALQHIMKDSPPDYILSGVNLGLNVGCDVNLSGTLGAAFTSLLYDIPSIGVSIKRDTNHNVNWDTPRNLLPGLLSDLFKHGWDKDHCVSINIPDCPFQDVRGARWTVPAHGVIPPFKVKRGTDLRDEEYFWLYPYHRPETSYPPESDVAAILDDFVSLSILAFKRQVTVPTFPPPALQKAYMPK